ncbi:hypothetical protein FKM82_018762 [Ascaphus truei]
MSEGFFQQPGGCTEQDDQLGLVFVLSALDPPEHLTGFEQEEDPALCSSRRERSAEHLIVWAIGGSVTFWRSDHPMRILPLCIFSASREIRTVDLRGSVWIDLLLCGGSYRLTADW